MCRDAIKTIASGIIFIAGEIIPLIILIGTLLIFLRALFWTLDRSLNMLFGVGEVLDQPILPIFWSYGKSMLIFIAMGLILMTALHMAKFSLYMQVNDVLDAVIIAAYAVTLIGVHRAIDILLKGDPLHWDTYALFGFLAVGGGLQLPCFL